MHSQEKRSLWGDLRTAFQYLTGTYRKAGEELFTWMCNDRTKGNDFKQTKSRLRLNIRKKFLIMKIAQRGCGFPIPGGVK